MSGAGTFRTSPDADLRLVWCARRRILVSHCRPIPINMSIGPKASIVPRRPPEGLAVTLFVISHLAGLLTIASSLHSSDPANCSGKSTSVAGQGDTPNDASRFRILASR
jgi:hypothetical protein